jgi:hypothetical protein
MKPRPYGSFARAVTRIREGVGEHQCAALVRRSPALIKKWGDPDHACLPNLRQSVVLDLAFVRSALGEPPIFETYREKLRQALQEGPVECLDLMRFTMLIQSTVTDLTKSAMQVSEGPSFAIKDLNSEQKREIVAILDTLDAQVRRFRRSVVREKA